MKINKVSIYPHELPDGQAGYFLSNDGEGMWFSEEEIANMLKDFLYSKF